MFSRLKQLVIAALLLSARGLERANSVTGAYKSDRLETNAELTRHVLHPDTDFTPCTVNDDLNFYLSDHMEFTADHFSACDPNGDTVLHVSARSGKLNIFTKAVAKAPTPLLHQRNHQGESLTDAILTSPNHDLLIPLFLATEAEQTVVSSALFNRELGIKLANHPSDSLKYQYLLQSLAMNKFIKPHSEAGKALFNKNKQWLIEQGNGLYLVIDYDVLSYDFEAALKKVYQEKLTRTPSTLHEKLNGLEATLPRFLALNKPYATIRKWSLLEALTAVQSLPTNIPYTHPDTQKMHSTLERSTNHLHETALWALPPASYNDIQTKLSIIQSMSNMLEKNPTHSEPGKLNQLYGIVETIIDQHQHEIHARWVINHALVLKANLLIRHGTINNRELLQLLLELYITCPGNAQQINHLFVQLYESGFNSLSPAEELLALRVLMAQPFFHRWEKKTAVLSDYKQKLTNYQPGQQGYLLNHYNELDVKFIKKLYAGDANEMIALERSRFQEPSAHPKNEPVPREFISLTNYFIVAASIGAMYLGFRNIAKFTIAYYNEYTSSLKKMEEIHFRLLESYWPFMEPAIKPDYRDSIKDAIYQTCCNGFFRSHKNKIFIPKAALQDEITLTKAQYERLAGSQFTFVRDKELLYLHFNAVIAFAIDFHFRLSEPRGIPQNIHEKNIEEWTHFVHNKISTAWKAELDASETYQQLLKDRRAQKEARPNPRTEPLTQPSQTPEEKEAARIREAEATLARTKITLSQLLNDAKRLAEQFGKTPSYQYSTIEGKVEAQAQHPEMKKHLTGLATKFNHLEAASQNEDAAKAGLTQAEHLAEAALSSNDLTALQETIATLTQSIDQAKQSIAVTKTKINAIERAKLPVQALFRELNTKQSKQAAAVVKPKQRPEDEERHRLFKAQRAERKRAKAAAPKAAAVPAAFPVIVINDALGIPLLKAQEALRSLESVAFAVNTFTPIGVLSLNVFIYTQLFEALLTLSETALGEGLPSRDDLVVCRNRFAHQFQKIASHMDGSAVDWVALAEASRAAFLPFVEHYLGNQAAQAAPAPAMLPEPFAHLFDLSDDYVHHDTTISAIKADYQALANWVEQQGIIDVNSPCALALRGMVIQLSELTNTPMLMPYRNQEAHNDLQTDMSVETLLNLRKVIAKINVKKALGPRLFHQNTAACQEENPPLRKRPSTKRH